MSALETLTRPLANGIDRWLLRQHRPFDVHGDGTGPAVCWICQTDWPCPALSAVVARIDGRAEATT